MKKIPMLLLVLLIIVGGALIFISKRGPSQLVSINLDSGVSGKLFSQWNSEGLHQPKGPAIASFNGAYRNSLKEGVYTLETQNSQGYEDKTIKVTVSSSPVSLDLHLEYTRGKLSQLLTSEKQAINQALESKYPLQLNSYNLSGGRLLARGDWFGAKVVPLDASQDTLRLLMHKVNNRWEIVSDPPPIVLTAIDFPNVPLEILETVNAF